MKRAVLAVGIATVLGLGTAACGGDPEDSMSPNTQPPVSPGTTQTVPAATPTQAADDQIVGPGCAALPTSGPGSPEELKDKPVATAVGETPDLSTLATAVKKAGLAETLNSAKDITVFAPTNQAFAKIPEADLNKILADKQQLTDLLKYHVVEGRKTPTEMASGSFKTLQGGTLTTSGSGTDYTVGDAKVVCGNLQTENAAVYLIDTVLTPPPASPTSAPS
ncbi:fasciclin domain-containing protein [Actinocorallia aurantiaca]|uniref:Fasciclin domain-containing protein n=1 Tax=Actinocorallia aurantiaca TaxID=46204 RepID=A0ABP6GE68_9ACTN